ncbi:ester cyclase [Chitinophaga polysaccharea]|uniref:ester cyclase n=1 Tax=Chitinophaga polysaccharea TaxID=1293035 RepID=UPI00115C0284|nr:ester cyclase [Chitinophaga polysaccharea]
MTIQEQKDFITHYINTIWNLGDTSRLEQFLHPDYVDHSLPPGLPPDSTGLKQWIALAHASFQPQTIINEQVAEPGTCMIRITMHMKHAGTWREIPPTGLTVSIPGYRCFRLQDNRIIEHRALIDGNTLEKKLTAGRTTKPE